MTTETNPSRRRALVALGVVIALLVVLLIAAVAAFGMSTTTASQETPVAAESVLLDLRAPGDVLITATDSTEIEVEIRVRDPLGLATHGQHLNDDVLVIESACTNLWVTFLNPCRVDYVVHVPVATEITGTARNGTIDIEGLDAPVTVAGDNSDVNITDIDAPVHIETGNGDVGVGRVGGDVTVATDNGDVVLGDIVADDIIDVSTSNGQIRVSGTTGPALVLRTDNGEIEIVDVDVETIEAETDNDSITMNLVGAPGQIVARTANGDIEILLPVDAPAYAVDARTSNGSTDTGGLVVDPAAANTIEAVTDNGDVTIGIE